MSSPSLHSCALPKFSCCSEKRPCCPSASCSQLDNTVYCCWEISGSWLHCLLDDLAMLTQRKVNTAIKTAPFNNFRVFLAVPCWFPFCVFIPIKSGVIKKGPKLFFCLLHLSAGVKTVCVCVCVLQQAGSYMCETRLPSTATSPLNLQQLAEGAVWWWCRVCLRSCVCALRHGRLFTQTDTRTAHVVPARHDYFPQGVCSLCVCVCFIIHLWSLSPYPGGDSVGAGEPQ